MHWLSIYFYPLETPELFLNRALRPFLQQYIWSNKGARAFFIRYQDEQGPHLRIRMHNDEADNLQAAFDGWMEGRGSSRVEAYMPETERFGGTETLPWAEEHFHLSSRVCLDRMARDKYTYGDAMFDALRMHTICAHAAKLDQAQAAAYFQQLFDQWLPHFFPKPEGADDGYYDQLRSDFANSAGPQVEELRFTLSALWKALNQESFDKKQPEWARWALGNQLILPAFGDTLEKVLPSLIHLSNNRLGLHNQDEVYLLYILAQTLAL